MGYASDRASLLLLSKRKKFEVQSFCLRGHKGIENELLFTDVCSSFPFASPPQKVIFVISGTHGIEGIPGSYIQRKALETNVFCSMSRDTGVILIHALNPWGCSVRRRVDHSNVDVNRSCLPIFPGPRNAEYESVRCFVEPREISTLDSLKDCLLDVAELRRIFSATVKGQYEFQQGIFYGGKSLSWSAQLLRSLCEYLLARGVRELSVIDIHTGLGKWGSANIISALSDSSSDKQRTDCWYDPVQYPSLMNQSVANFVSGDILTGMKRWLGKIVFTGIALEIGTIPSSESFPAIVAENWAFHHRHDTDDDAVKILQTEIEIFRKTFAPMDDEEWLRCAYSGFIEIWDKTLVGMS